MDRLNRVLRNQLRGQSQPSYPRSTVPIVLPDWVEEGSTLVYISKSKGDAHSVTVAGIDKRKQMVKIRFESDRRVWKLVPFMEIKKFGDGTLRPLWKKTEVATVPMKPKDFVEPEEEEEPPPEFAEAVDPTEAALDEDEAEDAVVVGPQLPPAVQAKPQEQGSSAGAGGGGAGARSSSLAEEAAARPEPSPSPESRARAAAAAAASAAMEEKPKKEKKAAKAKKVVAKPDKKEKGKDQEERGGKRERKRSPSSSPSSDRRASREKQRRR